MDKLKELQMEKAKSVEEMRAILSKSEDEKRDITDEEEKRYDELDSSLDDLDKKIAREERLLSNEKAMKEIRKKAPEGSLEVEGDIEVKTPEQEEFRNIGELIWTMKNVPTDERFAAHRKEQRVSQMKNGTSGGFAVPDQFMPNVLSLTPQEAIVRPRANVIPAGSPPDATVKITALDQTASANRYGGIEISHEDESSDIPETNMKILRIELKPKKLTAYVTISNELLNNWDAASPFIQNQMRLAMINASEADYLNGNGVNKAQGVFGAKATIAYNRATANEIDYADVLNMFARLRMNAAPVWVASQTTIPQLGTIADAGSNNLWVQSAGPGLPPTLLGIPVMFYERSPALGTKGDLMLADFSQYLIKDGSGPDLAISEHIRFKEDEVAIRLTWRMDGQPWLSEAIPLEGSTSNTISPFVVLDTP